MLLGPVGNKALPGPGDESVDFVIGYKEEEFNIPFHISFAQLFIKLLDKHYLKLESN